MGNNKELVQKISDASIIIAKKGRTFMEPGVIHAPYIPINEVEIIEKHHVMKVKDWLKRNSYSAIIDEGFIDQGKYIVESRYASKIINTDYYGVVKVESINLNK